MTQRQTQAPPAVVEAVVLTWNRKDLLLRCLDALSAQTRPPQRIVVIDNASTDGTAQALAARPVLPGAPPVEHRRMPHNLGASGGFRACFAAAADTGADYAWLMDDDVLPEPDALAALLDAGNRLDEPWSFLVSRVVSPTGLSMNLPEIDLRAAPGRYPDWDRRLHQGLIKVRRATFVSILVPHESLARIAPPSADFVMWGEDADWTLRATAWRPAWMVADSRAVHARLQSGPPDSVAETDPARLKRLFYLYRNDLFLAGRHYGSTGFLRVSGGILRKALREARQGGWARARVMLAGLVAGAAFRPRPGPGDDRPPGPHFVDVT